MCVCLPQVVNILVAGGVDLERVDRHKWSPLRLAVLKRRVEVVRVLVAAGADVQATAPLLPPDADGPQFPPPFPSPDVFACPDDMTALTLAALDNQLPIARILLAHTDASMSIRSNRVALAAAADRGYVQTRDKIPGRRGSTSDPTLSSCVYALILFRLVSHSCAGYSLISGLFTGMWAWFDCCSRTPMRTPCVCRGPCCCTARRSAGT